eukprot:CAMPEP_0115281222 /NCGR_PEP_ID=MMETSP0270-20121206/59206_1 /TAXON_ID=71861 /ORGANISM="Scrippsiella trochoidea, Strain CCMP3099" /LENGTH=249 /DNA_ID=CAMNT_0002698011 /DNA_START=25 /DNA_END=774 /DNA_ORIENTATION=+
MGNNIRVEIFYVTFEDLDLTQRAFVGVREFTDQPIADLKLFDKKRSDCSGRGCNRSRLQSLGTQPAIIPASLAPGGGAPAGSTAAAPASSGTASANNNNTEESTSQLTSAALSQPSSLARGRKELMLPQAIPTNDTAKDIMLVQTLSKWNIPIAPRDCCPFHSAVKDLQKRLVNLKEVPCFPKFQLEGNAQCQTCGALTQMEFDPEGSELDDDIGQYCSICHGDHVHKLSDLEPPTEPSVSESPLIMGL